MASDWCSLTLARGARRFARLLRASAHCSRNCAAWKCRVLPVGATLHHATERFAPRLTECCSRKCSTVCARAAAAVWSNSDDLIECSERRPAPGISGVDSTEGHAVWARARPPASVHASLLVQLPGALQPRSLVRYRQA